MGFVIDPYREDLAAAVVDALASSPGALARLCDLIAVPAVQAPVAYTVGSLAAAIGVSAKSIRNAITRGELGAVKRAGRWIISGEAVLRWSQPERVQRFSRSSARKCNKSLTEALSRFDREVSSIDVVQP